MAESLYRKITNPAAVRATTRTSPPPGTAPRRAPRLTLLQHVSRVVHAHAWTCQTRRLPQRPSYRLPTLPRAPPANPQPHTRRCPSLSSPPKRGRATYSMRSCAAHYTAPLSVAAAQTWGDLLCVRQLPARLPLQHLCGSASSRTPTRRTPNRAVRHVRAKPHDGAAAPPCKCQSFRRFVVGSRNCALIAL
eukprot:3252996-Prymnesium_polylepis.1